MSQPDFNEMQPAEMGGDPNMAAGQQPMPNEMGAQPMGSPGPGMPAQQAPTLPKQRFNVYTMMLIISFFALLTASLLLWFELGQYMENGGGWPPWDTSRIGLLEPFSSIKHLIA